MSFWWYGQCVHPRAMAFIDDVHVHWSTYCVSTPFSKHECGVARLFVHEPLDLALCATTY
jgi:hypothetical protein